MPGLTKEAVIELQTTGSATFVERLKSIADRSFEAITTRDNFGSTGYTPFLLGGMSAGREWVGSRVLNAIRTYGVKFTGKKYENTVEVEVEEVADNPAASAARIARAMADTAGLHEAKQAWAVLSGNAVGFDSEPLFGEHTYTEADGTTVIATYNNSIDGTGDTWYLCNARTLIVATRTGEDYNFQVIGGDNSEYQFLNDKVAMGWRARKIFAPGLWIDAVRSSKALTADNLQEAITLAHSFRNEKGEKLDNRPTHLVVPRSLEAAADKLIKAAFINGGDSNTNLNKLQVIVCDYL
jgi:phage major head subunit gpT-like protein